MQCSKIAKRALIFDEYTTSPHNGIGVYVKQLAYCLNTIGYTITFIMFNSEHKDFTIKKDRGSYNLYFPKFPYSPTLIQEKNRIISRFLRLYINDSADNIFFFNYSPADMLMKVIKQYYPFSKLIYTIHDLAWSGVLLGDEQQMKQLIIKKRKSQKEWEILNEWEMQLQTMDAADAIVCLSEDTLHFLVDILPILSTKIHLIPNAYRIDKLTYPTATKQELREQYGISSKEIILLFVGRMTEAKGILPLLKALPILRKHKNIRIAIAGSLAGINLNSFTEVMSSVIYLGHIGKEKLYQWYKIADIGMVTSYTEQCSYAGLEMMSYELPVIASDGFGVRCMFKDGINGITANIGDRKSDHEYVRNIVDAVLQLADNNELKRQFIQSASYILNQKYSIHNMKTNYMRLLSSI